jgi:hypothetical protein
MKKDIPTRIFPGTVSSNTPSKSNASGPSRPVFFLAFAVLLAVLTSPLQASPGPAWQETTISILNSKRVAEVEVPEGAKRIAVEVLNSRGNWIRWTSRKVAPGKKKISMRMPPRAALRTWRAWAELPGNLKFPEAFYKNKKSPGKAASTGYGETVINRNLVLSSGVAEVTTSTDSVSQNKDSGADAKTEEADIWRTDGHTVFFFNQLRGLQVIDLSNPSDPSLICSLRLPAVGQDLYLLPESGGVRHALLLARDPVEWDATVVYLVRIANGEASVAASRKIPGMLVDSRLKGNRLFLATQTWRYWRSLGEDQAVLHEVLIDPAASSISEGTAFDVTGAWPVISAGNDWIAVASSSWQSWNVSEVSLFSISEAGLFRSNSEPIRTAGRIYDKFKMQVNDGIFSAFSQGWINDQTGEWQPWGTRVTMLENFSVTGEKLAGLEIVKNEWLFATRFAGDKAYAVTFELVDPLWVIDLRNPAAPAITGHLEVPGWSTYIEPIGDMLFSIGWDEGRVAASLFDVADPANPTLASRVFLSDSWGAFSESLYDEKALKILPDENLALIPFSVYRSDSGDTGHRVQLLQIDREAKTLVPKGRIAHDFEPRRSAMVGDALASISQRQLVTADISNPDSPVLLSDLLLAWPVQRVATAGDFLYQISDGSSWWDKAPALRVSTVSDPDTILSEIDLGAGTILDAEVRENRLLVLRGERLDGSWPWMPRVRAALSSDGPPSGDGEDVKPALSIDVYDISSASSPAILGSTRIEMESDFSNCETSGLLFPGNEKAVVIVRQSPTWNWWLPGDDRVVIDHGVSSRLSKRGGYGGSHGSAYVAVFDTVSANAKTLDFPKDRIISVDVAAAADGIVVIGSGEKLKQQENPGVPRAHYAEILDLSNPTKPFFRKSLRLPGRLLAATELDRRGFLAWTEEGGKWDAQRNLAVGASDFQDVYAVAWLKDVGHVSPAIEGMNVFVAKSQKISGYRLADSAEFESFGGVSLDWEPRLLRLCGDELCAGIAHRFANIFATVPVSSFPVGFRLWNAGLGTGFFLPRADTSELDYLIRLPDGGFALPQGDYGIGVFR